MQSWPQVIRQYCTITQLWLHGDFIMQFSLQRSRDRALCGHMSWRGPRFSAEDDCHRGYHNLTVPFCIPWFIWTTQKKDILSYWTFSESSSSNWSSERQWIIWSWKQQKLNNDLSHCRQLNRANRSALLWSCMPHHNFMTRGIFILVTQILPPMIACTVYN